MTRRTLGGIAALHVLLGAGLPARAADPVPPAPMPAAAAAAAPAEEATPQAVDLGEQRYRIGAIELDKAKQRFRVPATLREREGPLEFLAVSRRGAKAYESLLELDASAFEFNLACVLIGLDKRPAKPARHHFDTQPAEGDPVALFVEWMLDGTPVRKRLSELLLLDGVAGAVSDEWVYVGSAFSADGRFLAARDGTLLGFVHDPASLIEHRSGLGLGRWGAVRANVPRLPPADAALHVLVERVRR